MSDGADILLVDDSPEARFVRRRLLNRAGFGTREAGTAAECFAAMDDRLPDVIVLDVHLPDAHGMDVCRQIKENPRTRHIGVIQVSAASVDPAAQVSGLEGGADAYLPEPIDPAVLVATVRAIVRERSISDELRRATARLGLAQRAGEAGVWDLVLLAGTAWWSPELSVLHGLPDDVEPTVDAWLGSFHPDDRERVAAGLDALHHEGDRIDLEARLAGGQERWVHVVGRVEDERERRVAGLTVDVTQRRRSFEQLVAIQQLTLRLSAVATPDEVLHTTLDAARSSTGATHATLVVDDGARPVLRRLRDGVVVRTHLDPETSEGRAARRLLATTGPVHVESREAIIAALGEPVGAITSFAAAPFGHQGRDGVLAVWREAADGFAEGDLAALGAVAEVATQALERSELYAAEARARAEAEAASQRTRLRAELVDALESERGLAGRMERAVTFCVERFADVAVLTQDLETAHATGATDAGGVRPALVEAVQLIAAGGPPPGPQTAQLAAGSVLVVPLSARGGTTGTLVLGRGSGRTAFGPADEELGAELLSPLGLVLDNARLDDEQRHIARTLQLSLLEGAALPLPPELTASLRYLPAETELEIGGDWHDVMPLPDGRVAIIVGDVVGHGLAASSSMGALRSATRALVRVLPDPAAVLRELDAFVATTEQTPMVTVACAVLDPTDGSLTYANAGHPPPVLVGTGGDARYLEGGRSLPLAGLQPARGVGTDRLAPGEVLVLYTDGLVERRGESLPDRMDRLCALAPVALRSPTLAAAGEEIIATLLDGQPNPDDIALVLVRRQEREGDAFSRRVLADPGALAQVVTDCLLWLDGCPGAIEGGATTLRETLTTLLDEATGEVDVEARCDEDGVHVAVRHPRWEDRQSSPLARSERHRSVDGGVLATASLALLPR